MYCHLPVLGGNGWVWRARDSFTPRLDSKESQKKKSLSSAGSLKRSTDDDRGQSFASSVAKKGSWLCRVHVVSLLVIDGGSLLCIQREGRHQADADIKEYTHTQQLPPLV